jgi:hypothetical protein
VFVLHFNTIYLLVKCRLPRLNVEAENECQSFGGHLVSIDGRSEMEFLHYLITVVVNGLDGDRAYIGMWLNEKFLVLLLLQLINKFDFKKLHTFLLILKSVDILTNIQSW